MPAAGTSALKGREHVRRPTHEHLLSIVRRLPTDYADYGGEAVRWEGPHSDYDADCSSGCKYAEWLREPLGGDWCVCTRADGPRAGLLTFEHMAGRGCFEGRGK
jgi:hypothetical protein